MNKIPLVRSLLMATYLKQQVLARMFHKLANQCQWQFFGITSAHRGVCFG